MMGLDFAGIHYVILCILFVCRVDAMVVNNNHLHATELACISVRYSRRGKTLEIPDEMLSTLPSILPSSPSDQDLILIDGEMW